MVTCFSVLLALLFCATCFADDYTCSASKPCKTGCCSKAGVCGLGPKFCGKENCISSCDAKSECDPGWGDEWSAQKYCPLNVCCSNYGFCGTKKEFCGDSTVKKPSCDGTSSDKRTVGYFEGWNQGRACNALQPEDIKVGTLTHLNYAFASIDPTTFEVVPMGEESGQEDLYRRITQLKDFAPDLQVWISVGGWSMNDPDQPTNKTFSELSRSSSAQEKFADSLTNFMQTYGFDGADIDWEYPVAPERGGSPDDYANFPSFLENLRKHFTDTGHQYGLTITIPSSYWYLRHFDLARLGKTIDWFNVMTYDLHGTWDSTDASIGSIVNAHTNLTEVDMTMDLLWRNDIDPDQVVMGLGFYGRSFTLSSPDCSGPGCPFSAGGKPGPCTNSKGTLSYDEITSAIDLHKANVTFDKAAAVKQAVWGGDQWVSWDDEETFKLKVEYANKLCLGGTMIWAMSLDSGGKAAMSLASSTGRQQKSMMPLKTPENKACYVSQCGLKPGPYCKEGFKPVQKTSGKGVLPISEGCKKHEERYYCCPQDQLPKCTWRGSRPACGLSGNCHKDEVALFWSSSGCTSGRKALCCTHTQANEALSSCTWYGTATLCSEDNKCSGKYPKEIARGPSAWGQQECHYSAFSSNIKRLCCTDPAPYENCRWYVKGDKVSVAPDSSTYRKSCSGQCPADKSLVAVDQYCMGGGQPRAVLRSSINTPG